MKDADLKLEPNNRASVILRQDNHAVSIIHDLSLQEANEIMTKWRTGEYHLLVE